jgi:hypothetical protein
LPVQNFDQHEVHVSKSYNITPTLSIPSRDSC